MQLIWMEKIQFIGIIEHVDLEIWDCNFNKIIWSYL